MDMLADAASAERLIGFAGIADPFSSISHLLGACLFLCLAPRLIRRGRGSSGRLLALTVFALSCAMLLIASGVYHLAPQGTAERAFLRRLDHGAIFILIAGTFTAAHAILFTGFWRWGMITLIWVLAAVGVVAKVFFFEDVSEAVGLAFYLGMGWVGVASGVRVMQLYDWHLLRLLLAGGLAYTVGAVLEFLRWPNLAPGILGPHELFHLCVLIGVAAHWEFLLRCTEDGFVVHAQRRAEAEAEADLAAS